MSGNLQPQSANVQKLVLVFTLQFLATEDVFAGVVGGISPLP